MRKRKATRLPRETRRKQILEAARVEFEEHGYLEAKVSRIAAQLGVVEGTVYRYFPSKRALLETLIADWYEQQTRRQREGLAGLRDFREKLRFVARQHLLTLVENAAFCAVLLKESRGQGGNLAIMVRQMNREYSQSLTQLVAEGVESGQLRPRLPARLLHHLLYGALEQLFWDHFHRPRELQLDAHIDQLLSALLTGCGAIEPTLDSGRDQGHRIADLLERVERLLSARQPEV